MSQKKSMKLKVAEALIELREEFTRDVVQAEKDGRGHYTEEDFASLDQFMRWLKGNY